VAEVHDTGTAQYGPIVMKTDAELEQAYPELRNGTSSSNVTNGTAHCAEAAKTRENAMSWMPAQEPILGDKRSCDALDLIIVPRVRDLGGGFSVHRALPQAKRQWLVRSAAGLLITVALVFALAQYGELFIALLAGGSDCATSRRGQPAISLHTAFSWPATRWPSLASRRR
jgi:hypothetical protein